MIKVQAQMSQKEYNTVKQNYDQSQRYVRMLEGKPIFLITIK
jgi:hypothetical protein